MSAVPRIPLVEPEPERQSALERKALAIKAEAQALVIRTADEFRAAGEFLVNVKTALGEIEQLCDPSIEAAHRSHKAALAVKAKLAGPLLEAEKIVKPLMATYNAEQERRRQEEQRRLQEEAKRKAEDERLELALQAEKAGDAQSAEELIAAPVEAPLVVVRSETKAEGVSFRENWKAMVVDLKTLVRAVADGTAPLAAIVPNQSFLDSQAKALKAELSYPGVKAYNETIVSGRRG